MSNVKRSNEPFLWMLFSAGGVVSAMLMPIHIFLFGLAFPLGWLHAPDYESLRTLASHPITRLYLLVFCALPLFHWAHRFRFTLYDGLQIKHLNELINIFCYGGAVLGTAIAAYLLWRIP
jgi:fumarate reductase subunit D